ncbi:MAG: zinc ribbon domain-containing protein [Hungatella sp.]|jgi:hypothetical protein|nr:zinc ribbon domain-containing protein [Hungatella sp.]MCI9636334.1 zinc ribbon domain-containing protein [Hungatella sp.]
MAVYCGKCGAEMNENDVFCGECGAPAAKGGSTGKGSGTDTKKYRIIGIAVIAVAVLAVGGLALKGIGGGKKGDGNKKGSDEFVAAENETEEENEVLAHLEPWMGEWMLNYEVDPSQPLSLIALDTEGYYHGHILSIDTLKGVVYVDEQYIDFSGITKNQKDRFPVSDLIYYESEYGADVFEDPDSERRILFYKHFKADGNTDYGEMMRIQAYVGMVELETAAFGNTSIAASHNSAPDGWAADCYASFKKVE